MGITPYQWSTFLQNDPLTELLTKNGAVKKPSPSKRIQEKMDKLHQQKMEYIASINGLIEDQIVDRVSHKPLTGSPLIALDHLNKKLLDNVEKGRFYTVKGTVSQGADVNTSDMTLMTPLMIAARDNHPEIARYLLKKGAKINQKLENGFTALTWSICNGNIETTRLLLRLGADYSTKTKNGFTPLKWAQIQDYPPHG